MTSTKICSKCGIEYTLLEFNKNSKAKDGRRTECKWCTRKYKAENKYRFDMQKKKYRESHKEEKAEYDKQYRKENKGHINKVKHIYREENKKSIAAYKRKYYINNKEDFAERSKKYFIENKDEIREYQKNHPEIGRKNGRNQRAKRNGWGTPQPINEWFEGSHLHHLHINGDHRTAIFIPATIHKYISHAHNIPDSMIKINLEVLHWYYGLKICWG